MTAMKCGNCFLCVVYQWSRAATEDAEFWIPKIGTITRLNPAAARTVFPIQTLKKTQ
jgi:hypothetical protein